MTEPGQALAPGPPAGARRPLVTIALMALPLVLAIAAEAAWISVVGGLFQEYALRDPILGIVPLVGFVAFGVLAARLVGVRLGARWPLVAAGLCLAGGAIGWLSSPHALEFLRGRAARRCPGGQPRRLARGARDRPRLRPCALAAQRSRPSPTSSAPGCRGSPWPRSLGGMVAEPFRSRFLTDAIVASIVFATSATLALALTQADGRRREFRLRLAA